ncbi:IS1595 family transposase, partial [Aquimarina sp. RZ0]
SYLDEYCYKFNRRYFESIFDRAIIAVVASNWKIKVQNIR